MTASRNDRAASLEWLLLLGVLVLLASVLAFFLTRDHREIRTRENERLATQARIIQEAVGRQFHGINLALENVRRELHDRPGAADRLELMNGRLTAFSDAMPAVRTMTVLDANGVVLAANRGELVGTDFSKREYFLAAQKAPDPDTLYVSPPFKTALGVWAMNLVRTVPGRNGGFGGVVSATVDPVEIRVMLASTLYAPDMWASIAHGDGLQLLMEPDRPEQSGMNLAQPGSFFTRHRESGKSSQVLEGIVFATGEHHLMALETIRPPGLKMDKPLVVAIGRDLSVLYAPWKWAASTQVVLFGLLALLSVAGFAYRQHSLRHRKADALRAREAIAENARRMELATSAGHVGVWDLDLDNNRLTWDPSMYKIYGLAPGSFGGAYESWKACVHPDDLARASREVEEAVAGHRSFDTEFRIIRPDGQTRHIAARAEVFSGTEGSPRRMIGINLDNTERKAAQAELEFLGEISRRAAEGINIVSSGTGRIVYANPAFEAMFGYGSGELIGQPISVVNVGPEDRARCTASEIIQSVGASGEWHGELENRRKDGSIFWTDAHVSGFEHPVHGPILITHQSDISARKEAERSLVDLNQSLEARIEERTRELAAAKTAAEAASHAKSVFLANMSHELRTPMNAILGMTSLALRHVEDPKLKDQLEKIDASSKHLLSVISDILDISKIEADHLELEEIVFRLGEPVENLAPVVSHRAHEKGLRLEIAMAPGLSALGVTGDPTRLEQILLNLVGNAVKFTEQGSVTLSCRVVEDGRENILLRWEISDTGIGIAADDQQRLFAAFEQADGSMTRRYGGTGLGLAISKRLVEMMDGEIGIESEPGRGSIFWFTVRLGRADGSLASAKLDPSARPADEQLLDRYRGVRILLAEDEPINQEVSRSLLEDAGLVVDLASDGQEAFALAGRNRYALILMDMQMPRLNGLEATQAIRSGSLNEDIPILAMTANAFKDDRQSCMAAGMNDFISKPVRPEVLYATLLNWLGKGEAARQ